jgi:hypothetical protein
MRKLVSLVLLLGLLTGCSRPRPVAEVEGEVTFDGQPVTSGIISFVPAGATGQPGGGAVSKGKYRVYPEVGLAPGKYRVEIRWAKPTGEKKEVGYGQSPDVYAEALPEKYHAESVLTAELEEGKNTVHFHLEK